MKQRKLVFVGVGVLLLLTLGWAQFGSEDTSAQAAVPGSEQIGKAQQGDSEKRSTALGDHVQAIALDLGEAAEDATRLRPKSTVVGKEQPHEGIFGRLFRVRSVAVSGNMRVSEKRVIELAKLGQAQWLWDVSPSEIARQLERDPWIESAEVERGYFPPRMEISVKESKPWVVLEIEGCSWLISRQGRMIEPVAKIKDPEVVFEVSELPRVDGVDDFTYGSLRTSGSINSRVRNTLAQLEMIETAGGIPFPVARYTLLADEGLLVTPLEPVGVSGVKLSVNGIADTKTKLLQLAQLVKSVAAERAANTAAAREPSKTVDMRFNSQAIVY